MGWSSGSGLAEEVYDMVREFIPEERRPEVAGRIYDLFSNMDADDWDPTSDLLLDAGACEGFWLCFRTGASITWRTERDFGAYSEAELFRLYLAIEDEVDARTLADRDPEETTKIHLRSGGVAACRAYSNQSELTIVFGMKHVTCQNCRAGRRGRLVRSRRKWLEERVS